MKGNYYVTTAIAYTSGKPHIGNTYEAILTDAIVRFKRMQGYNVRFQTGTDEHGQKIEEKAEKAGVTPQAYVDNVAGVIRSIWDSVGGGKGGRHPAGIRRQRCGRHPLHLGQRRHLVR